MKPTRYHSNATRFTAFAKNSASRKIMTEVISNYANMAVAKSVSTKPVLQTKPNSLLANYCYVLLISFLLMFTTIASAAEKLTVDYQITGISDAPLDNALQRLNDIQNRYEQTLTQEAIIRLYQQGPQQIKLALKPFGYFNARVKAQLHHTNNNWVATYQVKPGPLVKISQIDLNLAGPGADDPKLKEFIAHFPLKKGDTLITKQYDEAKQNFFEVAQNQGYLAAQIQESKIQVNIIKQQAHIILQFVTGPRYYFGPVTFSTHILSQKFLQRYTPFKQGQPYSPDKLLQLQDDLSNSPYFNQVLINPLRDQTQAQHIPILVNLKSRPAKQYDFGLGYGTDTGVRGSLGMQLRRLTRSGQRFNADIKASQINSSLLANYIFPGAHPNTDEYRIFTGISGERYDQGTSQTRQVGASYIKSVAGWQQTLKLAYQFETFRLTPDPNYRTSQLVIPSIGWSRVKADNILYPTHGYSTQFTIATAIDSYVSDSRFMQASWRYKWIHAYGNNSRLLLRADLGYIVADNIDNLPPSIRFYAGGTKSLRGYSYQQLGPGRYLAEGSIEYQHRIKGNWHGAIFYDTGNAFNHMSEGLKRGLGLGLVWVSPIGPINLSLAKALDTEGQPLMVQFSMGPDL